MDASQEEGIIHMHCKKKNADQKIQLLFGNKHQIKQFNFFVQVSYKQFNANGNEFLTQRNNYGNITYFKKWILKFQSLQKLLIRGNHDRFKSSFYEDLGFKTFEEITINGITFVHDTLRNHVLT